MRKRKKTSNAPRKVLYQGHRRTFTEIANLIGVSNGAVRKYYSRYKSLKGIGERKGTRRLGYSRKSGEGMNLDTLFLQGRVDPDTYARYLREFEEQQRHGKGRKAYATVVDGVLYYEMADKEDYFYGGMPFEDLVLHHPYEEVCDFAAEHLPLPDLRNSVIRETERGRLLRTTAYGCWEWVEGERWMPSGTVSPTPSDSPFGDALDDYLKTLEEAR